MLYHLIDYLNTLWDVPGGGLLHYLTFRSAVAVIIALVIALIFGRRIIRALQRRQIGEVVRDLDLEGQKQKRGTPTMGGIIILLAILVPVLLVGDLTNVYVWLMIITAIALGAIGFADDYIKVFRQDKRGLRGRFKVFGQIGVGVIVAGTMLLCDDIKVCEPVAKTAPGARPEVVEGGAEKEMRYLCDVKTTQTTIPFVKENEFDYAWLSPWGGAAGKAIGWVLYALMVIVIIIAVSNSANLTDGMDGMVSGISIITGTTLGVLAYLSGNSIYADYLNIMYIPHTGELVVFMAAFVGALGGFLWYNAHPAQVFMGDTGSLAIGGIIAVFAIVIRKELLMPVLCGIFFVESLSVIIQTGYFRYTKRRYGVGRRVFKMAPLHHHFQKPGNAGVVALIQKPLQPLPESKIVTRFWIITVLLAVISIVTLKIR
ncbi:MAG: phospho-N-acetylmuramoyl-pentapeptide-transferase [Prevotellaceae bacterium]|jgi:phospho-N-acetylmuramoyl-pentapeptide-transferase|nr:phospho-N-acetylmuramoyl-pentapeptide-transferase [Prevotellaceae bacterium]